MREGVIIKAGFFKVDGCYFIRGGGSLNLTYLIFC